MRGWLAEREGAETDRGQGETPLLEKSMLMTGEHCHTHTLIHSQVHRLIYTSAEHA